MATETISAPPPPAAPRRRGRRLPHGAGPAGLALGALGVVFGDIGTSPLYALQTVFTADHGAVHPQAVQVYGVISLVFWAITTVVSIKYVGFIMRADNGGEGGIMALTALIEKLHLPGRRTVVLVALGVLGASLFYGDGVITPAISVLSAVEGLKVAAPAISSLVLPITLTVIVLLFALQRFGTTVVGRLFGPVMAVWFLVLGLTGVAEVARHPGVLRALSPSYAVSFFLHDGLVAFIALASVVLAVTGAEALYADMGHFGRAPIRRAWFGLVFPALTLNYLAQGSLILRSPKSISNPFYLLFPDWAQIPMVLLATVATVIASQAVISGAYSVTRQALQLGFLPRLTIRHTSSREEGQIFVPAVNMLLLVAVVSVVVAFGSSASLASAYGIAVTGTFLLNTVLFLAVARGMWHVRWPGLILGATVILTVEAAFFTANLTKIVHGGWLPLLLGAAVFTFLTTWHRGQLLVGANRARMEGPLSRLTGVVRRSKPALTRVPGTAVFLNANPETVPLALRANVVHNHVLHDHVVVMAIEIARVPHIPPQERVKTGGIGDPRDHVTLLRARIGFQDPPDVPALLRLGGEHGLLKCSLAEDQVSYFVSRITMVAGDAPGMRRWRKRLFLASSRLAASPIDHFCLPFDRTVIFGAQVEV